jgi:hypothetical protein
VHASRPKKRNANESAANLPPPKIPAGSGLVHASRPKIRAINLILPEPGGAGTPEWPQSGGPQSGGRSPGAAVTARGVWGRTAVGIGGSGPVLTGRRQRVHCGYDAGHGWPGPHPAADHGRSRCEVRPRSFPRMCPNSPAGRFTRDVPRAARRPARTALGKTGVRHSDPRHYRPVAAGRPAPYLC